MQTTPQERAWAGEFGNDYHHRSPGSVKDNEVMFQRIFRKHPWEKGAWGGIETILELGAGTGANVRALKAVFPQAKTTAVELNKAACMMMQSDSPEAQVIEGSLLNWQPARQWDLVLTKGVLIHIAPQFLPAVYETIHKAAAKYILVAEYYSPYPVEVPYRGEHDRLWKRDFAGELLDKYRDLMLIDYGFTWRRDVHPQDDLTWFLLERT